jgi:hypothetical protein
MSLLVGDKDLLTLVVYYSISTNKAGYKYVKVLSDKKAKELLKDDVKAKEVNALTTKWRPQTWQAQNDLFYNSKVINSVTQKPDIDWTKFRDAQMKHCLVDWDLSDDEGRPYPVTEENINSLHSAVANALSNLYAEATAIDEDEMGG